MGEPAASRGSTGTFRETWRLRWEPELAVRVAEAGVWGTTVPAAATAKAEADALGAESLADVTALAERCLLAELPDALPVVMKVLADRAALDTDVGHLAQALPALVRSLRYGDVRGTDTGALTEVAAGLAERVFVGCRRRPARPSTGTPRRRCGGMWTRCTGRSVCWATRAGPGRNPVTVTCGSGGARCCGPSPRGTPFPVSSAGERYDSCWTKGSWGRTRRPG